MSTTVQFLMAAILPAVVAWSVCQLRRFIPGSQGASVCGLALALGFVSAYFLLIDSAHWQPTRNWHWLPYGGLLAAVVGTACVALRFRKPLALVALAVICAVFAWLIVPSWDDLWPPRIWLVPMVGVYGFLLTWGLMVTGNDNARAKRVLLWMSVSAFLCMVACLIKLGFTNALLSLSAASALAGMALALRPCGRVAAAVEAVAISDAVLVGGIIFSACIYPSKPVYSVMILPALPLVVLPVSLWKAINSTTTLTFVVESIAILAIAALVIVALLF